MDDVAYVGVDPGKTGAISIIFNGTVNVFSMPKTEKSITAIFEEASKYKNIKAIIEKVHAMPGQGVTSCFTFGSIYGFLRASMHCFNISFDEVTPKAWMKKIGLFYEKGLNKRQKKLCGLDFAKVIYPNVHNLNAKTADSLLIAHYAKIDN